MPKVKLTEAYRFNGQIYGPSYGEAIEVPEEVARAAAYSAEVSPTNPALEGTPADDPERTPTSETPKQAGKK